MRRVLGATVALALLPSYITAAVFMAHPQTFYFRAWEYFGEAANIYSRFPLEWNGLESGDLSRGTLFFRRDAWPTHVTTDAYGYRSVPAKGPMPAILVIGDSVTFGSGLSDDETVPWVLSEQLDLPVLNTAVHDDRVGAILSMPRMGCVQLVVELRTERYVPDVPAYREGRPRGPLERKSSLLMLTEINSKRWFAPALVASYAQRLANDLSLTIFHPGDVESFTKPVGFGKGTTPSERAPAAQRAGEKVARLKGQGREYLLMFAPASGGIYRTVSEGLAPHEACLAEPRSTECRDRSLDDLEQEFTPLGVHYINLGPEFRQRTKNGEALFFPTDTHWNSRGTNIAAVRLAAYVEAHNLISREKFDTCVKDRAGELQKAESSPHGANPSRQ